MQSQVRQSTQMLLSFPLLPVGYSVAGLGITCAIFHSFSNNLAHLFALSHTGGKYLVSAKGGEERIARELARASWLLPPPPPPRPHPLLKKFGFFSLRGERGGPIYLSGTPLRSYHLAH